MSLANPVGLNRRRALELTAVIAVMAVVFLEGPLIYNNLPFFFLTMVFLLLAYGIDLIYGLTGYLPFGYTVFYGLGAYGVYIGMRLGLDFLLSFLFSMAVTVGLAIVMLPLFRLRSHYFAIATLAALMGVYYLIDSSVMAPWTRAGEGAALIGVYDPTLTYYVTFAALVIFVFIIGLIKYGKLGLALRAIKGNVTSAALDGVNAPLVRGLAWLFSALMAGFAGAVYGWFVTFFYPDTVFTVALNVYVIAFTMFGGAGTLTGPLLGTLTLNVIYQYVGVSPYSNYLPLIFGVILVALVLLIPNGLVDLINRRFKGLLP